MLSVSLIDRLDSLIDDLILDGGVETASLASILLTAKDSVKANSVHKLSCQVWTAHHDMKAIRPRDDSPRGPQGEHAVPARKPFQTV